MVLNFVEFLCNYYTVNTVRLMGYFCSTGTSVWPVENILRNTVHDILFDLLQLALFCFDIVFQRGHQVLLHKQQICHLACGHNRVDKQKHKWKSLRACYTKWIVIKLFLQTHKFQLTNGRVEVIVGRAVVQKRADQQYTPYTPSLHLHTYIKIHKLRWFLRELISARCTFIHIHKYKNVKTHPYTLIVLYFFLLRVIQWRHGAPVGSIATL